MRQKHIIRHVLVTISLAVLVTGCSGPARIRTDSLPSVPVKGQKTADQLLTRAANSPFPENAALIIQASDILMDTDITRAKSILEPIIYDDLPTHLKETLAMQQASIAEQTGQNWEVFEWLDREAIINSADPATVAKAHALRAKAYNRFGEYPAALDEWLGAIPLLSRQQQALYQKEFWQTLLHAPKSRLDNLANQTPEGDIKGWLQLASLYQPGAPLDQQLTGLQQWVKSWPTHPGNVYIPDNFNQIKSSSSIRPEKIAVLLPLTGNLAKVGISIRDGIMAASYEEFRQQKKTPELIILDTYNKDINQLAEHAIGQGAKLIIGPLDKNNVARINSDIAARIPILALNYLEDKDSSINHTSATLFQFGLSTEDEARMVAARARLDGHKRAMVLTPKTSWGKKVAQAFQQTWDHGGGEVAIQAEYEKNAEFSQLTGKLLHVDKSHERTRKLTRLLRESLGFQARRRQDIDMIFIASSPAEARQIKPALSYQFAGDIPVYATSTVFSGKTYATRDQDMDSIRVPIMPWSVPGTTSQLELDITKAWPQARGPYGTLYALGADAYKLYPKLQQLQNLPGSQVEGLTGWLSINAGRRVDRELTWQIFKNGRLVPLPVKQPKKSHFDAVAAKKTQS